MNLVVDIGNSNVKMGIFDKNELIRHIVFPRTSKQNGLNFLNECTNIRNAIFSNVSGFDNDLQKALRDKGIRLFEFNNSLRLPVKNCYSSPETLGNDRIAAAVGAYTIYPGKNVLIIDAGSAITFDLLTDKCEYKGGNISPGLTMRFKALHEYTRSLPLRSAGGTVMMPADNTGSAIESGVQLGIIHEMDGYIYYFTGKYPGLITILTGGDANFFDRKLKNTIFVVQNLVLSGLNYILNYNEQKN